MQVKHIARPAGGFTLVEIMIVVAIIGLLASIAVPSFLKARSDAQRVACGQNLAQINGAKERWALENNKSDASPTGGRETEIDAYLGKGAPKCPGGGTYDYKPLGVNPTCTAAKHAL